ncbi:MAG: T9SS type A sorting domain-containing protein [Bacteroidota bacterium]
MARNELETSRERQSNLTFTLQPNPVTNELTVDIRGTTSEIFIYSLGGQLMYQNAPQVGQLRIDVSQWTEGMYYVQVASEAERQTKSFVITR